MLARRPRTCQPPVGVGRSLTEPPFLVTMHRMSRVSGHSSRSRWRRRALPAAARAREGTGTLPGFPSRIGALLPLLLGLFARPARRMAAGGPTGAMAAPRCWRPGPATPAPSRGWWTSPSASAPGWTPTMPQCRGAAPLTLKFVPLTSGNVTSFVWDFGDLTNSDEALPVHTYVLPGSYDVGITGMPGPPVTKLRKGYVVVTPNMLGDACDLDRQCVEGLTCVCGAAEQCPAAFSRGHCTQTCTAGDCPENSVCADLALNVPATPAAMDSWRARHCLRRCTMDRDCPAGRRCRLVPVAGSPDRWERACFYGFPADLGAACRAASGAPQNEQCLGGVCADLGALGVCSLDCSARPCPTGTVCAVVQRRPPAVPAALHRRAVLPRRPAAGLCLAGNAGPAGLHRRRIDGRGHLLRPQAVQLGQRLRPGGDLPGPDRRQPLQPARGPLTEAEPAVAPGGVRGGRDAASGPAAPAGPGDRRPASPGPWADSDTRTKLAASTASGPASASSTSTGRALPSWLMATEKVSTGPVTDRSRCKPRQQRGRRPLHAPAASGEPPPSAPASPSSGRRTPAAAPAAAARRRGAPAPAPARRRPDPAGSSAAKFAADSTRPRARSSSRSRTAPGEVGCRPG